MPQNYKLFCTKSAFFRFLFPKLADFHFQSWLVFTSKVGKIKPSFFQIKTDSKLDGNTSLHHIVIEWRPAVFGLGTMISYSAIRMLDLPIAARKQ